MAARCKVKDAPKVVWAVKANASFNTEIYSLLRNGIQNGKINFPESEQNCEEDIENAYKGYKKLQPNDQSAMKLAYVETTMGVYELVKLKYFISNGNIKVYETSGMRKDRVSSLAYNFWCASQLELQLQPKYADTEKLIEQLTIRRGTYNGRKI